MILKKVRQSGAWKIVAGVLVLLILGEAYFRFLHPGGPVNPEILKERAARTNLLYIPSLFSRHVLAPEKHSVYFSGSDDFRFELEEGFENIVKWQINSEGYRGPEFSLEKPAGTVRILIYGGSFVFDIRTQGEMDWPRQVERILNQAGLNVEVINAGIPGHMSFDSLGRFFTEGHVFDPDYAIICNKWNDLKVLTSDKPLSRQIGPMGSGLDPRHSFQGSFDRWMCGTSQLYCRVRNWYYEKRLPPDEETILPAGEYTSAVTDEALRQYRLHFEMFVAAAKHLGITPILMTQPLLAARDNTTEEKSIIEYEKVRLNHERLCEASQRADDTVRQVACANEVTLIDASASHLSGDADYFTDQVHLTREGSAEFAGYVAAELQKIVEQDSARARRADD